MLAKKPYLILPELIEQPTWGGNYIAKFKNINHGPLSHKKIGQSYELFGSSKLQIETQAVATISEIADAYAIDLLGAHTVNTYGKMPLLIKFTQSKGNSFQLHVRKEDETEKWKPKPESWYFFEEGLATIGLNPETDIDAYQNTCIRLEKVTQEISASVMSKTMLITDAIKKIQEEIQQSNPWQYVNTYSIPKNSVVDLSEGGIHHSWEEDPALIPNGNIVYEIQLDVTDASSTLRSFDKGKMANDGTIRELHIKDYFTFINSSPEQNTLSAVLRKSKAGHVIKTMDYCLDETSLVQEKKERTHSSFVHIFVRGGTIEVSAQDGSLELRCGQSCFIPFHTGAYAITPKGGTATVLKTYIPA